MPVNTGRKSIAERLGCWRRRGTTWAERHVPPGLRSVLGLILIAGGIVGFLPVLGFWMIPLGAAFIFLDLRLLGRRRAKVSVETRGGAEGPPPKQESEDMQTPLELTFRNMDHSDSLEALVREQAARLEKFFAGITSCHVYVTAPHRSQRKGNIYEVHIELRLPGEELVVNAPKGDNQAHVHPQVAVRDAFHAMEAQLKARKQKMRGDVKAHEGPLQGKIVELNADKGFGQIIATDSRLIYFHRNAVVDGNFDDLAVRDPVELVVQTGESEIGPQASTVRPIGSLKYKPA
ncbi:MAG: HPF/RaiA family ribosome-associated protein [Paracoccaceae bacterium]